MERAVPVLPSRDLQETLAFYEALGFPEAWSRPRGVGLLDPRARQPPVDPLSTDAGCYLYVDDADEVYADWQSKVEPDPASGSRVVAPRSTEYGMREFAVIDRNGNLVRVGSRLPT